MGRRLVLGVVAVVLAYGVGLLSAWMLNEDPCGWVGQETDRIDFVDRWLPPRTDCRITTAGGESRLVEGSSEVFLAMFALTLVLAGALLSGVALLLRAAAVAAACAAAFLVIFVI